MYVYMCVCIFLLIRYNLSYTYCFIGDVHFSTVIQRVSSIKQLHPSACTKPRLYYLILYCNFILQNNTGALRSSD